MAGQAAPRAAAVGGRTAVDVGLWPIALLGWLVRGGWLIVALPILTLPSPVGFTTLVGPDVVDSAGLTATGWELVALAAGVVGAGTLLAILISAWVEREARRRLAGSSRGEEVPGGPVDARPRLPGLVAIAIVAVVPLAIGLAVAAGRIIGVATSELEFPTRLDVPFVVRVVERAQDGVLWLVAGIVVADLLHAVAVRRHLAGRSVAAALLGAAPWAIRHPVRLFLASAIGWALTLGGCAVAIVVLRGAWSALVASGPALPSASDPVIRLARDFVFALSGVALAAILGLLGVGLAVVASLRTRIWTWALDGA